MYGFKKWCSRTESTVLQCFKNRTKTVGSDRPDRIRPVRPSIDHKTGSVQCKKPFLIEPANRRSNGRIDEPVVEPVVEPTSSHNFFFSS